MSIIDEIKALQKQSSLGVAVIDRLLRTDQKRSSLPPTSSKKILQAHGPVVEYQELNTLRSRSQDLRTVWGNRLIKALEEYYNDTVKIEDAVLVEEREDHIRLSYEDFGLINKRMDQIFDPQKNTVFELSDIRSKVETDDLGPHSNILIGYLGEQEKLAASAKKLKTKIESEGNKVLVDSKPTLTGTTQAINNPDKNPRIPERKLDRWVYDYEFFYIRPDNTTVKIDQLITEMVYTVDFDVCVMPIFTMSMLVNDLILRDLKNDFERLRFFMTVKRWAKNSVDASKEFVVKTTVFENLQLVPLDPEIPVNSYAEENPIAGLPRHRVIIDFVSKRNADLNGKVKSKIYSNVTVLDVITAILNDSIRDQQKAETADKDIVRFSITPPDNLQTYEQIILDPGTVAQNLKQLQEKYGVYQTGIRVLFDTVSTEKDPTSGRIVHKNIITVTEKGSSAPAKDSFDQVLVEVVDKDTRVTNPEFDSGSTIDQKSRVMIVRTMSGYVIDKKNSSKYLDGESVRVISSSQSDVSLSICDIGNDSQAAQRTYWGNNDNPFNLTQLQDSIREKWLSITMQVNDVDIFSLTQNLKYVLKFYNNDGEAHDGEYRLKACSFQFRVNQPTEKVGVPMVGYLKFTNIPELSVEGTLVKKESYTDKVNRIRGEWGNSRGRAMSSFGGTGSKPLVVRGTAAKGGPFLTNFAGRNDYLGQQVPKEIPSTWKMSGSILLEDVYTTKDGSYPDRAQAICQNFDVFCFAQKFSKLVLDRIIAKYGKFPGGGGRMNSFYRCHVPKEGSPTSQHLIALAADMIVSGGTGDALCEPFFWIAKQSGIDFDQVILEGNGSEWRWIHVGMNMNGRNRRQIKLSPTGKSSNLISVEESQFISPAQCRFMSYRTMVRDSDPRR